MAHLSIRPIFRSIESNGLTAFRIAFGHPCLCLYTVIESPEEVLGHYVRFEEALFDAGYLMSTANIALEGLTDLLRLV